MPPRPPSALVRGRRRLPGSRLTGALLTGALLTGALLTGGLVACSLSTDFDRPFEAPQDAAPEPDARPNLSCRQACEEALACVRSRPGCPLAQAPENGQTFVGACVAHCEQTFRVPAFTVCDTVVIETLQDDHPQAYNLLCDADEPLCVTFCETDGALEPPFLARCLSDPPAWTLQPTCVRACRELDPATWRCAGADRVLRPEITDFCESLDACLSP